MLVLGRTKPLSSNSLNFSLSSMDLAGAIWMGPYKIVAVLGRKLMVKSTSLWVVALRIPLEIH